MVKKTRLINFNNSKIFSFINIINLVNSGLVPLFWKVRIGVFEPISEYTGKCIAVIHRTKDDDDKLIIVPADKDYTDDAINALTEF